jgi:hypothetical protein
MQKYLIWLFMAELVVVFAVGAIFRIVEPRLTAAFIAGSLFVVLGIAIVAYGFLERRFLKTPTFAIGVVHLCGIALPLLITRVIHSDLGFADVNVWGLSGPVFHKLSTWVYLGLMVATIFDLYRVRKNKKASS